MSLVGHPDLLTLKELAALLRRSERSIYRELDKGGTSLPPFIYVGEHRRWPRDAVAQWLNSRLAVGGVK